MKVNSHNEWDKLLEVIVGRAESIAEMIMPFDSHLSEEQMHEAFEIAHSAFPKNIIDELNEDLEGLCNVFTQFGAKVLRPNNMDIHKLFASPNWKAVCNNLINMRDLHLIVGNTVIESPSPSKHRLFEATGLYEIWYDYFKMGFKWVCAPKPQLKGRYEIPFYENEQRFIKLSEEEILFDAANTVRMGSDLLYLVSASGNNLGAQWLQGVLGNEYKVHTTDKIYRAAHIDSTVLCLRPGLVLLNGHRVNEKNCPEIFKTWDKIYFNDIISYPQEIIDIQEDIRRNVAQKLNKISIATGVDSMSSEWIGLNILSLDPSTVVVDKRQIPLIRELESRKFTVIPVSHRYSYFVGGIHCNTLDTVRDSKLENYF